VDAARGRIYLPLEALARHQVREEEILAGEYSPRFAALAEDFAGRAQEWYRRARVALPPEDRRSMIAAEVMGAVYWRLLERVRRGGYQVLGPCGVRLGKWRKLHLVWRTWYRTAVGSQAANYGVS
jgi:phytoene synthase